MTKIILLVLLALILFSVFMYFFSFFVAAIVVNRKTLVRTKTNTFGREPEFDNEINKKMYCRGVEWQKQYDSIKKPLHIVNDGLNLYSEYYDLGSETCAIIVPGRSEALTHCYFYAKPYADLGLNFLVIDQRCHGESDGKYNTAGIEESKDLLCWIKYLHDELGVKKIYLHGICIGAACSMYAMTSENCPDYVSCLVAEGMYSRFAVNMKWHLIERRKNKFPALQFINFIFWLHTGHTMNYGPIDVMDKFDKPLLMIHSREDEYCPADHAQKLYDMCRSGCKHIEWYENGNHSKLRYVDEQKYDGAIKAFLAE